MSQETLHAYIRDGKVVLETNEGYYSMTPNDAAELGWSFLKLAFKLDKTSTDAVLMPEYRGTLQ